MKKLDILYKNVRVTEENKNGCFEITVLMDIENPDIVARQIIEGRRFNRDGSKFTVDDLKILLDKLGCKLS